MPRLPLGCIARVIECVDKPRDLLNLLTVSRDVFLIAAHCLYRDPLKSYIYFDDDKIHRLILFLLSLSPAGGNDIDIIRRYNDLPLSGTPLGPKPMLDYLSLVKVIHWRIPFFGDNPLRRTLRYPNDDMYRQLTWAFVGHRLDGIEELEIEVKDQERYLSNVAKMTRLRKIWIRRGEGTSCKEMHDFAEAMIKAIQLHHGPEQVSECHMIPSPIEWRPLILYKLPSSSEIDISISGAQRVFTLLPPPKHYLTLPRPDGSIVSLNHPFDPFVSTIGTISTKDTTLWKTMMKLYPGYSLTQILQRFRGMRSLLIDSITANGIDENVLAWATCEAEYRYHQPGGHYLGPLVPLEDLTIHYEDPLGVRTPRTRTATPKWKILQDGLLGFSGTLKRLQVIYLHSDEGIADRLFTIPRPLPKLISLSLRGWDVDRSVWGLAPNIETLAIDISFPRLRYSTNGPNYSQINQNTETSTFPPALVDTSQRQLTEIWFHCPNLTELVLKNRALCLLNQECLHLSPNLRSLDMSCEAQKVSGAIHSTRLTWDWSFPKLHDVSLDANLHEFGFSLAILRSCPSLRWIDLVHNDANHRFPFRIKGILDEPLNKNNLVLPFTYSNLLSIKFRGSWDIEVDELVCLLQVLPGLLKIEFGSIHFSEGFGA